MTLKKSKMADYRKALRRTVPRVPMSAAERILEGALSRHLRSLPPGIAVWQALVSHIRHAQTDYETLLDEGYDRDSARYFVLDDINQVLAEWGSARFLEADADTIEE